VSRKQVAAIPLYRTVLVTTDFSQVGDAAIPHAFALLGSGGGRVVVCHALERIEPPNPLYAHYTPGKAITPAEREILRKAIEATLASRIEHLVPPGNFKVQCRVIQARGPVPRTILKAAKSERADVIVISSHGYSRIQRLILGSTTERVLRGSSIPVLVVRGP